MRQILACLVILLAPTLAHATADGPDHWAVKGVASDDVLNIRAGPHYKTALLGTIPHDGDGLQNIDCVGGMTINEWFEATEAEREADRKKRWCLIGYGDVVGWVAAWYLEEGSEDSAFNGGDWYIKLAGSKWRLRDIAGDVVPEYIPLTLRFPDAGGVKGFDACDRFEAKPLYAPGRIVFENIERQTINKCLPERREVSKVFNRAIRATERYFASEQILVLFDEGYRVLATFRRRD